MNTRILTLLLISGITFGCATTVQPFSTNSENAWFLENDHSSGDTKAIFCMANKRENSADPVCYIAATRRGVTPDLPPPSDQKGIFR